MNLKHKLITLLGGYIEEPLPKQKLPIEKVMSPVSYKAEITFNNNELIPLEEEIKKQLIVDITTSHGLTDMVSLHKKSTDIATTYTVYLKVIQED